MTVVQNGKQCATCHTFSNSLQSLVSRFTQAESTASRTDVESKTPLSYLNKDELLTRAKAMAKSLKSVKDTMACHFKKQLSEAVANDGIDVDDDLSNGPQEVMSNATPNIMDSYIMVSGHNPMLCSTDKIFTCPTRSQIYPQRED